MSSPQGTVAVTVNDDHRLLPPTATLADLVEQVGRHPRAVAVELNGEIVRRPEYGSTALHAGDQVEIVQFVQGG